MESSTLVESDLSDYEEAVTAEDELHDQFADMTPYGRLVYFKRIFHGKHQPIQDMSTPDLCNAHPDFEDDIVTAYLERTTFTFKVWVNYDAACKKFYNDKRIEDCGKVVLNRKDRKRFEDLVRKKVEIHRMVVEVGTAFNTFCHITLRVDQKSRNPIVKCKPETGKHPELIRYLLSRCDFFRGLDVPEDQSGLSLQNIGEIAAWLLRTPEPGDMAYMNRFNVRNPWMDLHGGRANPGFLDFDALGKGESEPIWWST